MQRFEHYHSHPEFEPSVTGFSVGDWKSEALGIQTKGFMLGPLLAIGGHATESVLHSD